MPKKPATRAEKAHIEKIVALGCIACFNMGHEGTPAEYHHLLTGMGMGMRSPHTRGIPLCFHHHSAQGVDGIHGGQESWEGVHGTELELLDQCERLAA